jgi:hypothetical protein
VPLSQNVINDDDAIVDNGVRNIQLPPATPSPKSTAPQRQGIDLNSSSSSSLLFSAATIAYAHTTWRKENKRETKQVSTGYRPESSALMTAAIPTMMNTDDHNGAAVAAAIITNAESQQWPPKPTKVYYGRNPSSKAIWKVCRTYVTNDHVLMYVRYMFVQWFLRIADHNKKNDNDTKPVDEAWCMICRETGSLVAHTSTLKRHLLAKHRQTE